MPRPLKTSKEDLIKIYQSKPMTYNELSKITNVSYTTICKIFKENNIKPYSKNKIYSPNLIEDYFKNIDDEYKAYFLGIIISDGCVYENNRGENILSITLQDSDKYILQKFIECVKSNKNITSDGRGCYSIQILSNKMCNDLSQYNIIPRKSLHTVFPTKIPTELYRHFIRGLIDGDGSYAFYSRKNQGRKSHHKAIRFCQGNKKFIEDMIEYLYNTIGVNKPTIIQEKENLWTIAYQKDVDMVKIIDYIYHNSHIYIKRKYDTVQKIYDECYENIDKW
jgi:hypothetical protein